MAEWFKSVPMTDRIHSLAGIGDECMQRLFSNVLDVAAALFKSGPRFFNSANTQ
jgi:hypothetical protein